MVPGIDVRARHQNMRFQDYSPYEIANPRDTRRACFLMRIKREKAEACAIYLGKYPSYIAAAGSAGRSYCKYLLDKSYLLVEVEQRHYHVDDHRCFLSSSHHLCCSRSG